MTSTVPVWDAVVLAGGAAQRMGGIDKPGLDVAGRTLLEHALAAVTEADRVVVVGPERPTPAAVVWCQEEPPLSGPAAALAAALPHVTAPVMVLLAADQPFVDADVVRRLLAALTSDGSVAVAGNRPQWLCSAWRADALRGLALQPGGSLRRTLGSLDWEQVPLPEHTVLDCDTPDDLRRARELA
jgi:molybdopterin-guanine dinucleotide biosynthesis protein A